jgi:hypothetical protein
MGASSSNRINAEIIGSPNLLEPMKRETACDSATSSLEAGHSNLEFELLVRKGDLPPHALAGAATSRLCVCQFRHFRLTVIDALVFITSS